MGFLFLFIYLIFDLCLSQRWMMLQDVEAVLGSDREARLCFNSFRIWGVLCSVVWEG